MSSTLVQHITIDNRGQDFHHNFTHIPYSWRWYTRLQCHRLLVIIYNVQYHFKKLGHLERIKLDPQICQQQLKQKKSHP
jgi:hypothetical protein